MFSGIQFHPEERPKWRILVHTRIQSLAADIVARRIAKRRKQVHVASHSDLAIAFRRCLHFGGRAREIENAEAAFFRRRFYRGNRHVTARWLPSVRRAKCSMTKPSNTASSQ